MRPIRKVGCVTFWNIRNILDYKRVDVFISAVHEEYNKTEI